MPSARGIVIGKGKGFSRSVAKNDAAKAALEYIREHGPPDPFKCDKSNAVLDLQDYLLNRRGGSLAAWLSWFLSHTGPDHRRTYRATARCECPFQVESMHPYLSCCSQWWGRRLRRRLFDRWCQTNGCRRGPTVVLRQPTTSPTPTPERDAKKSARPCDRLGLHFQNDGIRLRSQAQWDPVGVGLGYRFLFCFYEIFIVLGSLE